MGEKDQGLKGTLGEYEVGEWSIGWRLGQVAAGRQSSATQFEGVEAVAIIEKELG